MFWQSAKQSLVIVAHVCTVKEYGICGRLHFFFSIKCDNGVSITLSKMDLSFVLTYVVSLKHFFSLLVFFFIVTVSLICSSFLSFPLNPLDPLWPRIMWAYSFSFSVLSEFSSTQLLWALWADKGETEVKSALACTCERAWWIWGFCVHRYRLPWREPPLAVIFFTLSSLIPHKVFFYDYFAT